MDDIVTCALYVYITYIYKKEIDSDCVCVHIFRSHVLHTLIEKDVEANIFSCYT